MRTQLSSIFDTLRGGADSERRRISPRRVLYEKVLEKDLFNVFMPLIKEMEEYGESLDREEFVESSLVLL